MSVIGPLKISAKLMCGAEPAIGPGKALVLEAVARAGSISAAGRELGMSYRRIWLLVDSLNRCWDGPLIDTSAGGRSGSQLTALGREILASYREMEAQMETVTGGDAYRKMIAHVRSEPLPSAPNKPHEKAKS